MSRRILHIIDSLGHTGTAKQLLLLAGGLLRRGFDVHIVELNASPRSAVGVALETVSSPTAVAIPITNLGRRYAIDPLADYRLARHVRHLCPDVVHTWDSVPGMFGPLAAKWARRWLDRRGAASETPEPPRLIAGRYRIERWRPAWETWIECRFAQSAAQYITNSPTVRDWCIANGLRNQRFTFIPPGVPPAPPSDVTRDELLRELNLPVDARLIGVVGRLTPEKRVQDLIWAADLLRVLHDNLRMLIIGDGPLRSELEQYARLASDLDHIRFLGQRDDVWRIMPHLDVLWNGSDNRAVSIAVLEAMAAGVPVLASDVPLNRDVVVEGETGYLIPIGHRAGRADRARHTDRIFSEGGLATQLGTAARQRIGELFDEVQMLEGHIRLYSEI